MLTRPIFLSLVLLGWSVPALAHPLTLDEALVAAVDGNADLRDAELALEQSLQRVGGAQGSYDPLLSAAHDQSHQESESFLGGSPLSSTTFSGTSSVGLTGALASGTSWSLTSRLASQSSVVVTDLSGTSQESTIDNWQASVIFGVQQDLLALLRPSAAAIAVRQAREQSDVATLAALETRQTVLAQVAVSWWSWESAWAQLSVAERAVAEAEETVRVTALWVEAGESERVELSRVQTELLAVRQALSRSRAEAARTGDALLVLVGAPTTSDAAELTPGGGSDLNLPALGDLDAHLARAREGSPTLARQRLAVENADRSVHDQRLSALPSLGVSGQVGMSSLEADAPTALQSLGGQSGFPSWAVGVSLSTPLGGRAAAASRSSANLTVEREALALDTLERRLDADVRDAARQTETASEQLELARARLKVAEETEAGEAARLSAGLRRTDQLLTARTARQDAESDVLLAELAQRQAAIELARLEGGVEQVLLARTP